MMAEVKDAPIEKDQSKAVREAEETLDTIVPQVEPRTVILDDGVGNRREYVQTKLGLFQKVELFAHLGNAVDKATSGEDGLSIGSVLGGGTLGGGSSGFDAQTFVQGVAKLAAFVPDVLQNFYCIVLNVPMDERAWAVSVMSRPEADGGFSDEEGIEIIETFFDHNGEDIRDFFGQKLGRLTTKWKTAFGAEAGKGSSKRSKATPRTIRKQ